ncbi:PAS domain-containing sensor histidine kinase [Bacteroidota bacterium]
MVYKNFRLWVIIRVILLLIALFLIVHLINSTKYSVTSFILLGIIIVQVIDLILYVEKTNKKLTKFLESIRYSDFSSSFSNKGKGKSFEDLAKAFNEVINEFKKHRAEKEEHYNYLQTVVQHINIGIIAFRKDGKVDIFNNAVKRLFRLNNLLNIQQLKKIQEDLPDILLKMKSGDNHLCKVFIKDELLQISINATEFRMRGEEYVLVSMQDIHSELEEKEVESWQKLIRVLTHEIMNSITPISSLANTVKEILIDEQEGHIHLKKINEEDSENIIGALETIQNRSQGLLNFVDIYRNLTRIPKPNFRYFNLSELFDRAEQLLKPKIEKLSIDFSFKVFPDDLKLTADPDLMDQVIINLLLNACDAVKESSNPRISVVAATNYNGRIAIEVSDNGYGIKPDILDKIFIPFFTSKKDGSGIGLSLSRQIMHLHKGNISVKSEPGEGSVFILTF